MKNTQITCDKNQNRFHYKQEQNQGQEKLYYRSLHHMLTCPATQVLSKMQCHIIVSHEGFLVNDVSRNGHSSSLQPQSFWSYSYSLTLWLLILTTSCNEVRKKSQLSFEHTFSDALYFVFQIDSSNLHVLLHKKDINNLFHEHEHEHV